VTPSRTVWFLTERGQSAFEVCSAAAEPLFSSLRWGRPYMPEETFRQYISNGHNKVVGWVEPGSFAAVYALNALQDRLGVQGGIAEIGVHHGRFFIALALARKSGEPAVAIDVFDMQEKNIDNSGCGDLN